MISKKFKHGDKVMDTHANLIGTVVINDEVRKLDALYSRDKRAVWGYYSGIGRLTWSDATRVKKYRGDDALPN